MSRFAGVDVKRAFDLVAACCGLVVLAPVLGLVSIGVRLTMGSPILFRQARVGQDQAEFELIKFRTMKLGDAPDAERMTKFGSWLRATSLDELPELVNVLRGEMSLVGPRPLLVEYLPLYSDEQIRRHEVRPGITGLAQVSGRNATNWPERLALDVQYVDEHSIRADLSILLRSIRVVLGRDGVAATNHATMPRFQGEQH